MDLNPAPFRGDAGIAHVSEDFFKMTFFGANVSCDLLCLAPRCIPSLPHRARAGNTLMPPLRMASGVQLALVFLSLPGRVLGSEIRPRKFKWVAFAQSLP